MIKIPDIYRKAWQEEMGLVSAQYAVPRTTLCDALVWALAQLMESEFHRSYSGHKEILELADGSDCTGCQYRGLIDPRHFWTPDQWRYAAIKKMEGGDETILPVD